MSNSEQTDRTLVKTVTFLASLVSETETLSRLTGKMRTTVESGNVHGALSDAERGQLIELRGQLEEYLMQKDPLRSFTRESLQRSVKEYTNNHRPHRDAGELGWIGLAMLISYAVGMLFFPNSSFGDQLLLAAPFPLFTLYVSIVWMFWSGLQNFRQELRKAYVWISIGILLTGLGAIQGPILLAVPELTEQPLLAYNGFLTLFTLSCLAIYIGLRKFVQFIGVADFAASIVLGIVLTIAVIGLVPLLPHGAPVPDEWAFDLASVSLFLCSVFSWLAAYFAYQVASRVTAGYAPAMKWLSATMAMVAINTVYVAVFISFTGPVSGERITFVAMPFIVSGILMFVSGYEFRRASGNA